jgi:hypothetical protein
MNADTSQYASNVIKKIKGNYALYAKRLPKGF